SYQTFDKLIFSKTTAPECGPLSAGHSITATFNLCINCDVRSRPVDRLNFNRQRVTAARPSARARRRHVSVSAEIGFGNNSTLRERERLTDDDSVRESRR